MNKFTELTVEENLRYKHHLSLPDLGQKGQLRLKNSSVLIVGLGGLGSPVATYLAAGGIGTIGLVDSDSVDISNLQRQILYDTNDVGKSKCEVAAKKLAQTNPEAIIKSFNQTLNKTNVKEIFDSFDVVVDCTDNLASKYLINQAAIEFNIPMVYGSVYQFEGQVSVFNYQSEACYQCLFPNSSNLSTPSCNDAGVLGVVPGIVGGLQANEVFKIVGQFGSPLSNQLLTFNSLDNSFKTFSFEKDKDCSTCSAVANSDELLDYRSQINSQETPMDVPQITPTDLKTKLDNAESVFILDVRESSEWEVSNLSSLGAVHIPKGEVAERIAELNKDAETVVHCRSGGRSSNIVEFLAGEGFTNVCNLDGGLTRWSEDVDTTMDVA